MVSSISSFPGSVYSSCEQSLHLMDRWNMNNKYFNIMKYLEMWFYIIFLLPAYVHEHNESVTGFDCTVCLPLPPTWDCCSAALVFLSGRSSLGSGSSQYVGNWYSLVCTDALQSAWYAGGPCLRQKTHLTFLHLVKAAVLINWSFWFSVCTRVMTGGKAGVYK